MQKERCSETHLEQWTVTSKVMCSDFAMGSETEMPMATPMARSSGFHLVKTTVNSKGFDSARGTGFP